MIQQFCIVGKYVSYSNFSYNYSSLDKLNWHLNRNLLLQLFQLAAICYKSTLPGGGVDLKTGGLPLDEGVQSLTQICHHLENEVIN